MLHQLRWRKKKADFIIPPTYFRKNDYSIADKTSAREEKHAIVETPAVVIDETYIEISQDNIAIESTHIEITEQNVVVEEKSTTIQALDSPTTDNRQPTTVQTTDNPQTATSNETKVSSLSLASIKAKKELLEAQKGIVKEEVQLPTESFTETQMQEFWFKYADRLGDKGYKIMESLLRINDPKLDGTKIIHELPNEGSKIDFEKEKHDLLTYLRSHLHNHEISIEVLVNESIDSKKAFTPIEKYNRLNEINPNLDVLRKTFDLDI